MSDHVWTILVGFLWMFGIPLLVWFLKDLQVEHVRKKLYRQCDEAELRANHYLSVSLHFERALRMIASRKVRASEIALDALNAAERK